jgi:hypothetical protein
MASYTWQGNQSGHVGDIGYAANYSPSGTPAAGDSVSDTYGSANTSTGTSAANWSLGNCNISGGTFNGSVTISKSISAGTFTGSVSVYGSGTISGGTFSGSVSSTGGVSGGTFSSSLTISAGTLSDSVTLTNCTALTIAGVTFKPHASSFGLTAGNLLYGQTVDDVVGTLHEAATTDVRHGTQYGAGGTAHTGSAYIPAAADVRHGTNVDATTGTCYVPAASYVLYGVNVDNTTGNVTMPNTIGSPSYTCNPALILSTAHFGANNLLTGQRTDCPANQALSAASYGDPGAPTTGTVTEAATTDVRHGTQYGAGGTAHTGSAYIPAANTVLSGTNVDATTGTVTEAATTDVRHGTQYGAGGTAHTGSAYIPAANTVLSGTNVDATTGTVTEAATTDVRHGTQYGAGGTAHTGSAYIPAAADVRHGTNVDATTGTCYVPAASNVIYGVNVDTTTGNVTMPNTIGPPSYTCNPALILSTAHFGANNLLTGQRTDCPANQALSAASYGDPGAPTTGTVTEAATTDVRHGTQYGAGGTAHTGSACIPPANTVLSGVNVDATTGTLAFLAPQDVADAMKLAPTSGRPAAGSVMDSLANKTGYKLAPDGLDAVDTTAPSGPAANFRQMLVQLWRRFFKKAILDHAAGTLVTYADDGASVLTTQVASETQQVETQGPAT